MISEKLQKARDFEAQYMPYISDTDRPAYHVTGGIGWINDPNGFSVYKGEYHLFYQYHPYANHWGPMHWGHVKTKDFIKWERLPVAMAPDSDIDRSGCFSGSALELPDGRQLILYTGVYDIRRADGIMQHMEHQCIAVGDGVDYEKYEGNPVLDSSDLPDDGSIIDFRDPKIWKDGDSYFAVAGNRTDDGSGCVRLFRSEDAFHWKYAATLDRCRNEYGRMWECPDFFPLDGRHVMVVSPQDMIPMGLEFHAGNGVVCFIGDYDKETYAFTRERVQSMDYGLDFYAPQTLRSLDGRCVMIAWMQNWATSSSQPRDIQFFGMMTVPRELSIRKGRLVQNPVRELEKYRSEAVVYEGALTDEMTTVPGVSGRILDMTVTIRPTEAGSLHRFRINVAENDKFHTSVRYNAKNGTIRIDRSRCGFHHDIVNVREFYIAPQQGEVKLRILLDRYSMELFVNDGEQAASSLIYTDVSVEGISFSAEGSAQFRVEKYDLNI